MMAAGDRELLKSEYFHVQNVIESFDNKALIIKAWSVTFSLTAVGAAYTAKSWQMLGLAALASISFWLLEGSWKTFQYAYYERSRQLERYFAGSGPDVVPLQITGSWSQAWKKGGFKRFWRISTWLHVANPHVLVVALAVLLLGLHWLGWAKIS